MNSKIILILIFTLFISTTVFSKTVEYDLVIQNNILNFTGEDVVAMTVNGGVPGPALRFNEGDTARINVTNKMDVPTSVHWHGILLPNWEDGVPYLTTPPIKPGTTFTFEFPLKHFGTYWYHSHTGLQEQLGVYGSIVIYPKEERADIKIPEDELVVVLSDWTNYNPHEVLRTLKRGSEYNNFKKNTLPTVYGVLKNKAVWDNIKRYHSEECLPMILQMLHMMHS